jgi:hypothetical protein
MACSDSTILACGLGYDLLDLPRLLRMQWLGLVLFDDLFDTGVESLAQGGAAGGQPALPPLAVQEIRIPEVTEAV